MPPADVREWEGRGGTTEGEAVCDADISSLRVSVYLHRNCQRNAHRISNTQKNYSQWKNIVTGVHYT